VAAPLASMTGYARASGGVPGVAFVLELKSVNARGLDLRARMTPGFDALEGEMRRRIGAALSRGAVTLNLNVEREGGGGRVVINRQALGTVLAALQELDGAIDAGRPTLDGILGLKGVLEQHEGPLGAEMEEALNSAILIGLDTALTGLKQSRADEGARLGSVLLAQIAEIAALRERAAAHPSLARDVVLARLREQIADLVKEGGLSEERLAQEALLLATKADIREELDRLSAHIASARQLIAAGGPVGRKLDFLSQEFNREANTLCSKSSAVELTAIGLDLKAVIDQFREQVQNLE
jgi:uncharacterized protein (TIGR00255 family)